MGDDQAGFDGRRLRAESGKRRTVPDEGLITSWKGELKSTLVGDPHLPKRTQQVAEATNFGNDAGAPSGAAKAAER